MSNALGVDGVLNERFKLLSRQDNSGFGWDGHSSAQAASESRPDNVVYVDYIVVLELYGLLFLAGFVNSQY